MWRGMTGLVVLIIIALAAAAGGWWYWNGGGAMMASEQDDIDAIMAEFITDADAEAAQANSEDGTESAAQLNSSLNSQVIYE